MTKPVTRLHQRIDRKLTKLAADMPRPAAWYESWSCLDDKATPADRFWVCQLIRNSGTLPHEANYFLISWAAEALAEAEAEMNRQRDPLEAVNLLEACRTTDRVFVQLLQQNGELEMADLFVRDRKLHEHRREAGRLFFFAAGEPDEPLDPQWLESFLRMIGGCIVRNNFPGQLEHRVTRDYGFWQIHVLLPVDQAWALNIEALQQGFAEIDSLGWYAVPSSPADRPYFWVEGEYLERRVFVRISAD